MVLLVPMSICCCSLLTSLLLVICFTVPAIAEQDDGGEAAEFSYIPDDEDYGPYAWADLDMDNNQCGGYSNSPIAIEKTHCDLRADYNFTVSSLCFNNDCC